MIPLRQISRRFLKWIGIAIATVSLVLLVLFGIAYAINMRDEPLAPRTIELLRPPANPLRPEENLYIAMAGFEAPPGESVFADGLARIDRYNRQLDALLRDPSAIPGEKPDPLSLQFKGEFQFPKPSGSYWNAIPPHRLEVEKLLADNRELYQRYLALHQLRGYFQTARPSTFVPLAYPPAAVRHLFIANLVLRMRSNAPREPQQALADLEEDSQLWRVMLAAEGTLVSKMLAIAYLHADEQVLADAIADPHAPIPAGPDDAQAVAPLFPTDDWNIGNVFSAEFRVQHTILEQMRYLAASGWTPPDVTGIQHWVQLVLGRIENHFFQPNATENLFAELADGWKQAAAPGAAWPGFADSFMTLRAVYNPTGKFLAAIAEPGYRDFPARGWDGAAFQRLVRLSYEIRRQRIDATGIPAFMKEHPEWSTHPQDGRSFVWDSTAGTIRIQTLGKDTSGRVYFVKVWQAAPAS